MKMFMCDGGDFVGTAYECELHVRDQNRDNTPELIKCWGFFQIGSTVHKLYLQGVHPMSMVCAGFAGRATNHTSN